MAENDSGADAADAREAMIRELQETARLAQLRHQYGAALRAQRAIGELQGLLPVRPRRAPPKKTPRREPTLLEAADMIAAEAEAKK